MHEAKFDFRGTQAEGKGGLCTLLFLAQAPSFPFALGNSRPMAEEEGGKEERREEEDDAAPKYTALFFEER